MNADCRGAYIPQLKSTIKVYVNTWYNFLILTYFKIKVYEYSGIDNYGGYVRANDCY